MSSGATTSETATSETATSETAVFSATGSATGGISANKSGSLTCSALAREPPAASSAARRASTASRLRSVLRTLLRGTRRFEASRLSSSEAWRITSSNERCTMRAPPLGSSRSSSSLRSYSGMFFSNTILILFFRDFMAPPITLRTIATITRIEIRISSSVIPTSVPYSLTSLPVRQLLLCRPPRYVTPRARAW